MYLVFLLCCYIARNFLQKYSNKLFETHYYTAGSYCNNYTVVTVNEIHTCIEYVKLTSPIVHCSSLTTADNGLMSCSLGDDGVPSYEDTCSFTCNTGYELIGSDTRTCQSNGSWSGSDSLCRRGV